MDQYTHSLLNLEGRGQYNYIQLQSIKNLLYYECLKEFMQMPIWTC